MTETPKPLPPNDADLQDALQELIESGEQPDAETLERIVARHPEHAAELTDFAVEWALQELLPDGGDGGGDGDSAVPAAMERFRARLAELDRDSTATKDMPADPFAARTAAELKALAASLALDKTLVAKLRDRKIVAESIPTDLRDGLATELAVPAAAVVAHLDRPAAVHAAASFKAAGKPEAGPKETFADAIRRSFLDDGEKARWLGRLEGAPSTADKRN